MKVAYLIGSEVAVTKDNILKLIYIYRMDDLTYDISIHRQNLKRLIKLPLNIRDF